MPSIIAQGKQPDHSTSRPPRSFPVPSRRSSRIARTLAMACLAASLGSCNVVKDLYDYVNPANSFLDPSQVGRFDRTNPFGNVRPIKWPILDQLDVIDQPADPWAAATDPTPADLIPDKREYIINPGDAVHLSIFGLLAPEQEWTRDQYVTQTGGVPIPYVGVVQVDGLTPQQAQDKIAQVSVDKGVLQPAGNGNPGPQVSVSLLVSQGRVYSIVGTVNHPATYSIYLPDLRLMTALAQAGDITGGTQPGLDYIYVIRSEAESSAVNAPPSDRGPMPTQVPPSTGPAANPLEAIESILPPATQPAPSTAPNPDISPATSPATAPMGPGSAGPAYLGPLPSAVVISDRVAGGTLAQNDLDSAISGGTVPGAAATTAPTVKPPASAPADELLNQAIGSPTVSRPGQYVFIDGKWVLLPSNATPTAPAMPTAATPPSSMTPPMPPAPITGVPAVAPPATPAPGAGPNEAYAAAENVAGHRIIRIPIIPLPAGDPRYNIVIRPGDMINVPSIDPGEFYIMGHVGRPGVYQISGRKITLKMAVAAAGNLDSLAIPRRCDLIRRIGNNQEAVVQVNLQAIFDGDQPDIFLKPNDLVNVGTDLVSPFLAVMRNAYRFSYGYGFVYDRNYAPQQSAN